MVSTQQIIDMAKECGFSDCGIIPVSDMAGYAKRLDERFARFPDQAEYGQKYYDFAYPLRLYPWAKAIIIGVRHYGKYRIPENLQGKIGKFYLTNNYNPITAEYKGSVKFDEFLKANGIRAQMDMEDGVVALRWAALQAGLGIARKNNFFYTEKGSWVRLEAWMIDRDMEYKVQKNLRPCPEKCNLCVQSCPTKALAEPYMTRRTHCIEYLTAKVKEDNDFLHTPLADDTRTWLYGCDACQDACPMNRGKWQEDEEFPELEVFEKAISPEQIIEMEYDFLENTIQPKFWELAKEDSWKWKVNALNYMRVNYGKRYDKYIYMALLDRNANVCNMARKTIGDLKLEEA